jgi:hypothetical protein
MLWCIAALLSRVAQAASASGTELQPADQIALSKSSAWSGGPITLNSLMSGFRIRANSQCTKNSWSQLEGVSNSSKRVAYLCVARAGTESIQAALQRDYHWPVPHLHGCTLEDLTRHQAERVIVLVRHPAERFISTISRHRSYHSKVWKDFKTADALVTALRREDDPKHAAAYSYSTEFGYAMPIVEYYLQPPPSSGIELAYVCTNNMTLEYNALAAKWGLKPMEVHAHKSSTSASESPRSQFSEENFKWLEDLYNEDVKLCRSKCPNSCAM